MSVPQPAQPVGFWNVANILTLVRILLVPVFLALLLHEQGQHTSWRVLAALVFAVAAATDYFDGKIARERGLISNFGKIADPIADKLLTGAALIGLSILGELPWWITMTILVREWGITVLRLSVLKYGVIAANRGGKLKTLLQILAIGLLLFGFGGWLGQFAQYFMYLALAVTVVTGFEYIWQAWRLVRQKQSKIQYR